MAKRELMPSPTFMPVRESFEGILNQTVTRVSIEAWSVRILFETGELHIEGAWRLIALDGVVVDQSQELNTREQFRLWQIVNGKVQDFRFFEDPLPRFTMRVADHWNLEVSAEDSAFEDWSLTSASVWIVCNGPKITVFRGDH